MRPFFFALVFTASAFATAPDGKYLDVVQRLTNLQQKYPKVSRIFSIGENDEGTPIYAIRISITPENMDPRKIGHVLVSTHHGNEPDTPEFTLAFIEDLLKRYSNEEVWKGKLADIEYSVIPVLNVTGYNRGERLERGIDPNRNYPGPCPGKETETLKSIRTFIAFLATRTFAGSVTIHGYLTSLTYPWGLHTDTYDTQDRNRYDEIVRQAAEQNHYPYGNGAKVLYPANGCYEDYVYWKYGTWSMLVEIDSGTPDDIARTVPAVATFFNLLDSSASTHNVFTGKCVSPSANAGRDIE